MKSLSSVLTREISLTGSARSLIMTVLFAFLTFAGAMIRIPLPMTPVPVTLQTFVLFMAVYYLKPKELGMSQLIYVIVGLVGAPVFAAGVTGMLALVGPTAGYLAGFIVAGVVMCLIKEKIRPGFAGMAAVFAAGITIIYIMGAVHLVLAYKMSVANAFLAGIAPFLAADAAKLLIASSFALKGK